MFFLFIALVLMLAAGTGCGDDDDDDDSGDDDDSSDDDDDDSDEAVPTTLDVTLIPVENPSGSGQWELSEGPGEPHIERNDLDVVPVASPTQGDGVPLSMAYFITMSDNHQTDEESATRLTFFDSADILDGTFDSAYRPQEDLSPHQSNAIVRTANRIQTDYGRDFDVALVLGDSTDNAQFNEMKSMIDLLDAGGLLADTPGYARPDSGDLDIDPDTGLNRGERDFGIQETDGQGNNINAYDRPGQPNSNADFPVDGLVKSNGNPLPWFFTIGNHDALNTGNFDPDSGLTFFSRDDYVAGLAPFGFIPGVASVLEYIEQNPDQPLHIDGGVFGIDMDWRLLLKLVDAAGWIGPNWELDIDPRFDLLALLNDTPAVGADDGVDIAPDNERAFMGHDGLIPLLNDLGHGFADNNNDATVDEADGGWYRVDWNQIAPGSSMPLRLLVMDTTDVPSLDSGGFSDQQLNWLGDQLDLAELDDVLVVVMSHHYGEAITTKGEAFMNLLNGTPNVVLHLAGHGHRNDIVARRAADQDPAKGYWEVQTPSGVEFPQQSRIFEIVDNRDGTGTVYVTLFDYALIENDDADKLADLARDLAFADDLRHGYISHEVNFGRMGSTNDRNVALRFALPDGVAAKLGAIESDGQITSVDSLGWLYN